MALLSFVHLAALISAVIGHGRVMDPPSRASAWRFDFPTAPDYDDTGSNCGGFAQQWIVNHGKCGICGDPYNAATPRAHELGGIYGQGVIVASYKPGTVIPILVDLTTSHRGFWQFKLCPDPYDIDQDCFDQFVLELEDGGTKYYPTEGSKNYSLRYRLPSDLFCEHCVLQWRYTAGNNWGVCKNGTEGLGCGNQEQFGACSDITIGDVRQNAVLTNKVKVQDPYIPFYLKLGIFKANQGLRKVIRKGGVKGKRKQRPNSKRMRFDKKLKKKKKKKKPIKKKHKKMIWL